MFANSIFYKQGTKYIQARKLCISAVKVYVCVYKCMVSISNGYGLNTIADCCYLLLSFVDFGCVLHICSACKDI